jgi:alkaline phosphatase
MFQKIKSVSIAILLAVFISTGCSVREVSKTDIPKPAVKNIILFIGDGMGTAQVYGAMTVSKIPLTIESFPYSGFSKIWSSNNYITDSGAAGTAIACGVKTKNGMIGMLPDSTVVPSITEILHKKGIATGVLSTCQITHATPASFVAHNVKRANYEEIANDFLSGTADVFIGGGEDYFRSRKDGRDLAVNLKEMGYDVAYNMEDLKKSGSLKLAGLLAKKDMPRALKGRQGMLAEMTGKAIETMSRDKDGFFLMVEGSMIDWGASSKDLDYTLSEVIDLDDAVRVAKEFAEKNGETLIVVTADHETGGMYLSGGNIAQKLVTAGFNEKGSHTGVMVPIFSYGPGAEKFSGIHDNTFFMNQFLELLNISK